MSGGFDLLGSLSGGPAADGPVLPCSARGCSAEAEYGLRWNNPRIHTPARRKTWLACADHRDRLTAFLSDRGFLKETVTVAELPGLDDPVRAARPGPGHTPTSRGGDAE